MILNYGRKKIKRACIKEIPRIIKHEFISEAIESIRVLINTNSKNKEMRGRMRDVSYHLPGSRQAG